MGQKFFEDSIGTTTYSSGVITLSASVLTIGGQQYQPGAITYTISGLSASTKYNLFAVVSNGVVIMVASTNSIATGPVGYTSWKYIRSFVSSSSSNFGSFVGLYSDPNPIGTVIHSMLTLAQFQNIYGTNWVLADGSSVSGSMYALITGLTTVPDARGIFLRGAGSHGSLTNANGAAYSATLGTTQTDQMQGHRHGVGGSNSNTAGAGFAKQAVGDYTNTTTDPNADGSNGAPRTGVETRPANVAVNIFIKINMD